MNTDEWVTADEAAELLGVKRRSVYHYARRLKGFPQPRMRSRTPFWRRDDLVEWRQAHPARQKRP